MKIKFKNIRIPLAIALIGIIVISGLALFYFKLTEVGEESMMDAVFYRNGEPIRIKSTGVELTTISGVSGITDVQFIIKVNNSGNVTLRTFLEDAQPLALFNSVNITPYDLKPGEEKVWTTPKLATVQFEPLPQPAVFSIKIKQNFTCPVGNKCKQSNGTIVGPGQAGVIYLTGFLSYTMEPDLIGVGSNIKFESSTGSAGSGVISGETSCLSSGTTCSSNSDCCSGNCQSSTTQTTNTIKSYTGVTSIKYGSGCSSGNYFLPCNSSYTSCVITCISGTTTKTYDPASSSGCTSVSYTSGSYDCVETGTKTATTYACA